MRLFVAVPLPESLKNSLVGAQKALKEVLPGVRWVKAEQLHLTLKFLGETPEDRLAAVEGALESVLASRAAFPVELAGIGAFPSEKFPRVVWAGVHGGQETLRGLAAELEKALEPLGFPREERPFQAHLTLGRFKDPRPAAPSPPWREWASQDFGTFLAAGVNLFRSRLHAQGPVYEVLRQYALKEHG